MNLILPTGTPSVPRICQTCLAAQPGSSKSTPPIVSPLPMSLHIMVFSGAYLPTEDRPARPSQMTIALNTPTSTVVPPILVPSGENLKASKITKDQNFLNKKYPEGYFLINS